jgi:hypothetical protein
MTAIEIQAAHDRLDAAEEAVFRSRYLSDELMAEYADAGHTYYAVLRGMDPASASRIHSEHYNQHRPEIRARACGLSLRETESSASGRTVPGST